MKKLLSLILAAVMLLLPTLSLAETYLPNGAFFDSLTQRFAALESTTEPKLTMTLATPDGEVFSTGLAATAAGDPAFFAKLRELQLVLTEAATYLGNDSGAIQTGTEALIALLQTMAASTSAPEVTEADLQALMLVGIDLLGSISPSTLSYAETSSTLSFHLDLDGLLRDIDKAMPTSLTNRAAQLDPLLAKFGPYLFGTVITSAQLAQIWPELGLSDIHTGFVVDVKAQMLNDAMTLKADIAGLTVDATFSGNGLNLSLLPPGAAKAYIFSTDDVMILAELFATMLEVDSTENAETGVVTTRARITRENIARVLNVNAAAIDDLLTRYDPWICLFSGTAVASTPALTSAQLIDDTAELPAVLMDVTTRTHANGQLYYAEGTTGSLSFLYEALTANYWVLRVNEYNSYITVVGYGDRYGDTITLTSSEFILGAHTITLRKAQTSYLTDTPFAITTDTDSFHLLLQENYDVTRVDAKIGSVAFNMAQVDYDQVLMNLTAPDFYLDLTVNDAGFDLSSTFFGLDMLVTDDALTFSGYVMDEYENPNAFTLLVDEDNELMQLNILTDDSGNMLTRYQNNELRLESDGDVVIFRQAGDACWEMTVNGQVIADLVLETSSDGNSYRFHLTVDGEPVTLTLDFEPDPVALPANAEAVSPEEFMQQVITLLEELGL